MKKIGILGGIAWPSTAAYYAGICQLAEAQHGSAAGLPAMPEIVIESLDLAKAAALVGQDSDPDSWLAFDAYHRQALQRLQSCGANFAVIASNTAHHRLKHIVQGIGMPVLSVIEIAAATCARLRTTRALILGTDVVMASSYVRDIFRRHGIHASGPPASRNRHIIAHTIHALQMGRADESVLHIRSVIDESIAGRSKETTAVYLGCTELPMVFPEHLNDGVFDVEGVHFLNSTALHIQAAFEQARAGT